MLRLGAIAIVVASACSLPEDAARLPNSSGKDDSATLRLKLTDSNPMVSFIVGCDQPNGCAGHVVIKLKAPEPCALFPDEARCGITRTDPLTRELAKTTITSTTEGTRELPFRVESTDGHQFSTELAAAFTARGEEDVEVTLEKIAGSPDLTIELRAEWQSTDDPGAAVAELKAFLATVPGLTFSETGTAFPNYRAFALEYEQPFDHANPALGTFKQQVMLHHRERSAPTILYTSGYALFTRDYLSELGSALQANHLSTEQRWFGTSRPDEVTPESWRHVNIEQAAKDHHRLVQALRPFYSGKWLSTGHSKGGMTSIFHRRFFPEDVDATVAYVAPISYASPDLRYVPFLDAIGEEACRNAIRGVQKNALEQFDQLLPLAAAETTGMTFERTGGHASSFEKIIIMLEWLFWQHYGVADCGPFLTAPTDVGGLYTLISSWVGPGYPDSSFEDSLAYYYQAQTQLGMQAFSTTHLAGLLDHEDKKISWAPMGTTPVHDPAPMADVQDWVKTQASELLLVYGEYDPWSGGAYEVAALPEVVKLVAPKQPHGAMIVDLAAADRDLALRKIEQWVGVRPSLEPRGPTPQPALPRLF